MADVPEAVQELACFPVLHGPEPPAGQPAELLLREGYAALALPGLHGSLVEAKAIRDVDATIEEVRDEFRRRGKDRVVWSVPDAARPEGLAESLLALGFLLLDDPPFEARVASMALDRPPPPGPDGVATRPARTFEDFLAAQRVADDAFLIPEDERRAWAAHAETRWQLEERAAGASRTFLAHEADELVGSATALLCPGHVLLVGAAVRADRRGRGIYRALVRARWEAAVARGTPVLSVSAGRLSRPVLERAGFGTAGWTTMLVDRFA